MKKELNLKKSSYVTEYFGLGIVLAMILTGSPALATHNNHADSQVKIINQAESQKDQKKGKQHVPAMVLREGLLTVNMPSTTLNQAMKEFQRITGIKVLWQGPESDKSVSLVFQNRTVEEAIRYMLDGENYMLLFSSPERDEIADRVLIIPTGDGNYKRASVARPPVSVETFTINDIDEDMRMMHELDIMEQENMTHMNMFEDIRDMAIDDALVDDADEL